MTIANRLVAALAMLLLAYGPAGATTPDLDTGPLSMTLIAPGVYAVEQNFGGANGALILNDGGHVVVDTHGSTASAHALIAAAKSLSDVPIRYVINTHWHVDHHSGNRAYRDVFGDAVVFVSHDDTRREVPTLGADQFEQVAQYRSAPVDAAERRLAEGVTGHGAPLTAAQKAAIEAFRDQQAAFVQQPDYQPLLADLTYSDTLTLHGTPQTVEVFFLHPSHTKSDTIVYLPDNKVLIVGDILTQPILWAWSSFPTTYVQTLRALEALPVEKIVIGHGGPVLAGKAYLQQAREFLEAMLRHVEVAHADGLSEEAAFAAAADNADIQAFRRRFVGEAQDGMFDQMVGWVIARAYVERQADALQ